MITRMTITAHTTSTLTPRGAWLTRLLLAALLALCSEIILWTNPTRPLLEWARVLLLDAALAALLIELAARFRVRDFPGVMTLGGIYGMLNGLIVNPDTALIDVPRTLLSRALGGHALMGVLAVTLFWLIAAGGARGRAAQGVMLTSGLGLGIVWGFWGRWSPPVFYAAPETSLITLLIALALGVMVTAVLLILLRRVVPEPAALLPDAPPLGVAFVLLIGGLIVAALREQIDGVSFSVVFVLTAFAVGILWFQRRRRGVALLDQVGGFAAYGLLVALVVAFAVGGVIGYGLPRESQANDPIALIGAIFTAYGVMWLPAVAFAYGVRAFTRLARGMQL